MTLLIDSSVLIGHLNGDDRCTALLEGHVSAGSDLRVSVVTWVELLAGGELDNTGEAVVLDLLESFSVEPVTSQVAARAGRLLRQYARSTGLRLTDALIAGTAFALDCPVATLDRRHLARIPGLVPVQPEVG